MQKTAEEVQGEEHKKLVEIQQKIDIVTQENQKLKNNYEVIKEHEIHIIRDCEQIKANALKEKHDLLVQEKEKNFNLEQKLQEMTGVMANRDENIKDLQRDLQTMKQENERLENRGREGLDEMSKVRSQMGKVEQS